MKPPPNATVTRCCTNTSSGLSGDTRDSTRPAIAARRAAAASTSSSVFVGTSVTRLTRPGAWPLRPARCSSRATPFGLPICSTRSTGRKSTPRSRLDVATTALSEPSFKPASTHSRTLLSSEPWCSAICPAHSGRAVSSNWYQISACERTLVKTSVVPFVASISSTTGCCICAPRCPPHEKRPGSLGSSVSMTIFLSLRPCTSVAGSPHSVRIASPRLPSVADKPHTASFGFQRFNRASANCTCTPRLLPMSSCHSSTITVCTPASSCAARSRVSISDSDSGVVTSAVGMRRSCLARSPLGVSPVRWPTVHAGATSGSGNCNARVVSAASARIGVSHSTPSDGAVLPSNGTPTAAARANAPNHTA